MDIHRIFCRHDFSEPWFLIHLVTNRAFIPLQIECASRSASAPVQLPIVHASCPTYSRLEVWAATVWAVVGRVGNAAWVGEGRDGNTERRSDTRSTVLEPLEMLEPLHSLTGNGVGGVGGCGREGG